MNPLTDEQIVQGLKDNNEKVVTYLYQIFGPKVLGIVAKNSGSEDDGYDVLQETITKVWHNVREGRYESKGRFRQYFFTVAYNIWLYELRKGGRLPTNPIDGTDGAMQISGGVGEYVEDPVKIAFAMALEKIESGCQDMLKRFHLDKIPSKQIAEENKISDGTMRKRLYDCRERLKKLAAEILGEIEKD